jgi:hypothetical protein
MDGSETKYYNSEVCRLLHSGIDRDVQTLTRKFEDLCQPEKGILAEMERESQKRIDKVDAKLNWLLLFLFTSTVSALAAIGMEIFKKSLG